MSALRRWLREERMRDLDGILAEQAERARAMLANGRCPSCEYPTDACCCLDFGIPDTTQDRVCAAVLAERLSSMRIEPTDDPDVYMLRAMS